MFLTRLPQTLPTLSFVVFKHYAQIVFNNSACISDVRPILFSNNTHLHVHRYKCLKSATSGRKPGAQCGAKDERGIREA